jgi:hypothetical protein
VPHFQPQNRLGTLTHLLRPIRHHHLEPDKTAHVRAVKNFLPMVKHAAYGGAGWPGRIGMCCPARSGTARGPSARARPAKGRTAVRSSRTQQGPTAHHRSRTTGRTSRAWTRDPLRAIFRARIFA